LIRNDYDAVVIGAGPAGSMAAYEIAEKGFSVLLLEKHKRPGLPICCAEAVSRPSFEKLINPKPEWISAYIEKAKLVTPNNKEITVTHPGAGYILDRSVFDYDLAQRAVKAGTELRCEAIGLELQSDGEKFNSIQIEDKFSGHTNVNAKIFISAEGVESRVARLAGIDNHEDSDDVESLLQYRVSGIEVDSQAVEIHVGEQIAPKGYLWIFPKSDNSANIGLGIAAGDKRGEKCERLLERFLQKRFGQYNIEFKSCGIVPKYQGRDKLSKYNLLIVGDSARVLDSFSGAGIVNALMSGRDAGVASVEYLSGGINSINDIDRYYPDRFLECKESELRMYRKLRKVYTKFKDDDFNDIVTALKGHFPEGRTDSVNVIKLLTQIIRTRPQLLRLVRYLI